MLLESLLLLGCLNGRCSEVTTAYLHNKEDVRFYVKQIEKNSERLADRYLGPKVIFTTTAAYTWLFTQEITVRVSRSSSVVLKRGEHTQMTWVYSF